MNLKLLPPAVYHNFKTSTIEGMYGSLAIGLVNPFLGLFAVAMGAPNIVIGLITSLPALINVTTMIPAARFADGYSYKLPLVFWGSLLSRVFYLAIALIPFLPGMRGEVFVILLALMTVPGVILNLSWTSMVSGIFPVRYRADLFGRRNAWCGAISMVGTILAGWLLDRIPHPYNWSVIFVIAFLSAMASTIVLRRHTEDPPEETPTRRPYFTQLREMMQSETGQQLRVFLISSAVIHLGFNYAAPLWAIYFGRELELTNSLVGWMATTASLTTVISSMFWGRKISLHGDDFIFALSAFGMAIWPALFGLSTNPLYMVLMHGVSGVFIGGFNLTIFNLVLSSANFRHKSASIATFHTLNALTGFVGPFIGTWSLSLITIQQALWVSTLLRMAGFVVFAVGFRQNLAKGLQKTPETF